MFIDLASNHTILKDPARAYIGNVARQKPFLSRGACKRVLEVAREGANQEKLVGTKTDGEAASQNRTGPAFLEYWHWGL